MRLDGSHAGPHAKVLYVLVGVCWGGERERERDEMWVTRWTWCAWSVNPLPIIVNCALLAACS
jgi:hypothetical protein